MDGEAEPAPPPRRHRRRRLVLVLVAMTVLVVAILAGILPRLHERALVRRETAELAIPQVIVIHPEPSAPAQRVVLPGSVEAFASAPIFARTSGYVKTWHADIGTRVKKGQLLAELEVPEVEQQLQQARGTLAAAQANLKVAQATAARITGLAPTHAVSQQDVDNATGAQQANEASVRASQANVRQLESQLSFAQVRAPFDGMISVRNVDIGDLVNAGSSTAPNTALFQIVQSDRLRVYVSVPEVYAPQVRSGSTATLVLAALPNRTFTGTVVRTASAIDPTTRTLRVEIQLPNETGELYAGAYAQVQLDVPPRDGIFTVPVEALVFQGDHLQLATVGAGSRVVLASVTPGRDFGDRIEILAGLTGSENIILNPPDSITAGQQVRVTQPAMARRPQRGSR